MSFVYTFAAAEVLRANINFTTADLRVMLLMNTTTANNTAGRDAVDFNGITTLGEYDHGSYPAGGIALLNEAVATDSPNDRGEFDATDITFTAIQAATKIAAAPRGSIDRVDLRTVTIRALMSANMFVYSLYYRVFVLFLTTLIVSSFYN